ncbi:symmetrical bis(5'-nucleosyl)-tetraphosphatase [Candidatus Albibeggiatoa sp. nov. NOAA]|uniref:symmetrical bis(5'-nucleosyl)-tetraphosphatase n=1 Tax=Candidatus Albibeggiatoa sp. nov. NOAA TaxID=3162724 RepID=UPI00330266A2|nr:symmetrical bis(5'-nucleosyl)-tetraphosphatase [Thiotrichaceae bacterium]
MATYAVGDIQGCFDALQQLLAHIKFDPKKDTLWCAGDLVNRGSKSLEVLRFIKQLGDSAVVVLGNHDLHLLALSAGNEALLHKSDTLKPILEAEDCDEIIAWLRQQPFLHHDKKLGFTMIHAGLPPQWDFKLAQQCARELEILLKDDEKFPEFMQQLYGDGKKTKKWSNKLEGWERVRFISNCFTRMRYCNAKGKLELKRTGSVGMETQIHGDDGFLPWYVHEHRKSRDMKIIFGHWATQGFHAGHGVFALDTGCLWGGILTALRLEDEAVFSVRCKGEATPKTYNAPKVA